MATPTIQVPVGVNPTTFKNLPVQERAVQWAAQYADKIQVREVGFNEGFWVTKFLGWVGLGGGYAWCAAFISYVLMDAGWTTFRSAAVLKWRDWAIDNHKIGGVPTRGDLAYWVKGDSRHIEIVIATEGEICPKSVHESGKVPVGMIHTIGGNTSPQHKDGSQEDGDGVYRRLRPTSAFTGYIRWWR